jgi:hypothetical protein
MDSSFIIVTLKNEAESLLEDGENLIIVANCANDMIEVNHGES